MASEEQHAVAVIAALNAAGANAYDLDELARMDVPPARYTEVTVSRRFGGERRQSGHLGSTGWRITARSVAKTVSDARNLRRLTNDALEYARLTVDGQTSGQVQFETAEVIGPDDGWFSGLTTYTYSLMET